MYEQSKNHILPYKTGLDVTQSPTVQDAFRPIPGLISFAGVTERWGLPTECSQVAGLIQKLVKTPRSSICTGLGPSYIYIYIYSTLPLFLWQQLGIIFHILTGSCRFCKFWNIYPRSCKNDVSYKLPCLQCKLLDMFTNNTPCL